MGQSSFDPVRDLPQNMWKFIASTEDEVSVRKQLAAFTKQEVASVFRALVDARAELAYKLSEDGRIPDASEDELSDIAETALLRGSDAYLSVFKGSGALPSAEDVRRRRPLFSQVSRVFEERFGGEIYDQIE